jgi:hypothetical protein
LLGGDGTWALCLGDTNYYGEHPEYFAMDDTGKRSRPVGQPMLCTSNRDVWKIIVEKIRKLFDQGYDGVELAQSDGWSPCLCPACQKEFGDGRMPFSAEHPAERVWVMHKAIMDELAKSHPEKKVLVTVYGPTRFPSKRFACLPDNAIAEWCSCGPDDKYWQGKFKASAVVDYYICGEECVPTGFVPAIGPQWLQARAKMWRDCGMVGAYGFGRGVCWGLGGPAYYASAKLAADPDANLDKLLTDYCDGVYGEAGRTMERFFRLLHSRSNTTMTRPGFENGYPGEDAFAALYPPSVVNKMDQLLKKAEKTAQNEKAKGWLKYTRDCFDGLKSVADMFAAKRAYELEPTREMLQLVKDRVEAFEQWRVRIIAYSRDKAYINRWFPAYYGLCRNLVCDGDSTKWNHLYYHQPEVEKLVDQAAKGEVKVRGTGLGPANVLEPITWDFGKMMANIGCQREEKSILVRRTTVQPGPDGALAPDAWAGVNGHIFEMYHAANSTVEQDKQTVARLLYDAERLYVRFECNEPRISNMQLKSVGKDGNVYYQDEVELFLNPECSSRKYMHFMAAPVRDSSYDERKGYIDDPVDPRYAVADISWNADWTYAYSIDKDKKMWVLEMSVPFKSLGSSPPKSGDVWTGNLARCRRADGGEDLSCWVAEEFGNPEVFGELVFADASGEVKIMK